MNSRYGAVPWGTHQCATHVAETLVAATVLQACRYLDAFDVSAAIASCYHVLHRTSMEGISAAGIATRRRSMMRTIGPSTTRARSGGAPWRQCRQRGKACW